MVAKMEGNPKEKKVKITKRTENTNYEEEIV
jgi:hypothetical protein